MTTSGHALYGNITTVTDTGMPKFLELSYLWEQPQETPRDKWSIREDYAMT